MGLDIARGKVSMTPVVKVDADADSDEQEAIHHDIKQILGGKLEYTKANEADKWFYKTDNDVVASGTGANLIPTGGAFTEGGTSLGSDHVKFLFIKHSGTTDGTTSTSANLFICLDGNDMTSVTDIIEIGKDEAIVLKFKDGLNCTEIHALSSSGNIRCTIAGIIDDLDG